MWKCTYGKWYIHHFTFSVATCKEVLLHIDTQCKLHQPSVSCEYVNRGKMLIKIVSNLCIVSGLNI